MKITRKRTAAFCATAGTIAAIAFSTGACGEDVEEASTRPAELDGLVEPTITEESGNPTCGDFNSDWEEFKIDAPQNGTFTSGDGYLSVTISNFDGKYFDWTSTEGLDAVFVKGGPGGLLYSYDPEAQAGNELTAVRGGKNFGVSHISFCYDVEFARISIGPDAVNEAGDSHTFGVNVEQKIGFEGAWEPAVDGTEVDVNLIPSNGATPQTASDTCVSGTSGGQCSVTFTSPTAGIVTGHASADVVIGNSTLHVETDGDGENSASAVKRFVDASISIEPDAVNEVGQPHTFIITTEIDDGTGSPHAPPVGTPVTLTLDNQYGALAENIQDGCAQNGTNVDGQCAIMFVSNSPGSVTATASMTVDVGGLVLTRTTDGTGSNSEGATKRFVDAWLSIAPDGTNDVRDYHTFTVSALMNDGQGNIGPVPVGTTVNVTLANSNGATATDILNECASSGTGADGTCTVSFRSDSAGTIIGHAAMTAYVGGVALARETNGQGLNSSDAVKIYVDAAISINPSGINGIGEEHTFTVTATQDDGQGNAGPVPNGTFIDVTLTAMGGAVAQVQDNGCASGTIDGSCDVTFTSDTAGTIAGHASVTFEVGGLEITRHTDGLYGNSTDATKEYVAGSLSWTKIDADTQAPLGGATFEVCKTADWDSASASFDTLSSPQCQTVTDYVGSTPGAGDQDGREGHFTLAPITLGRYTITETQAPDGYTADAGTQTVELSISSPSADSGLVFVNRLEQPNGCTPGFWKNHTELWDQPSDEIATAAGFRTRDGFNAFFGLTEDQSPFGDRASMEDAINAGGGDGFKLARHGVAALLNLATGHPYDYSSADLKAEIAAAFVNGTYEPLASELDRANNVGCLVD